MPVFETGAFNHSATCPRALKLKLAIAASKAVLIEEEWANFDIGWRPRTQDFSARAAVICTQRVRTQECGFEG